MDVARRLIYMSALATRTVGTQPLVEAALVSLSCLCDVHGEVDILLVTELPAILNLRLSNLRTIGTASAFAAAVGGGLKNTASGCVIARASTVAPIGAD